MKRVTVVTSEVLGHSGTGGPGTGDSLLAIALGRHGHEVELLVAPGRDVRPLSPDWETAYEEAGVRLRPLTEDLSVRPSFLVPSWHVYNALRADPPDVVVADDWRALAFAALRARQAGRALTETAFVLYCHGPARVFAAAAQKVPDTVARFGEEVAQRACFELADAVVSPSEWLVSWLREHHWPERPVHVVPNIWKSMALGQPMVLTISGGSVLRIAFFGQLREGKGIRVFLSSLRKLDPALLERVEVLFLGYTRQWTKTRLEEELGFPVRLETELDRDRAIDELKVPGTLAVMPSLLENSPYAVAECLENAIPFLASDVGGARELVAAEDRARVLCPPTPEGFASALERVLREGAAPARPARETQEESLANWLNVVASVTPASRPQTTIERGEWVVVPGEHDEELRGVLMSAQAASGADAVTTAVRTPDGLRLFLGDPGALGLVENQYGVVGLVRREVADEISPWLLFARIALAGGRIVSIPDPVVEHEREDSRAEALAVLELFEAAEPAVLQGLPQLTATLAAALSRAPADGVQPGLVRRGLRKLLR